MLKQFQRIYEMKMKTFDKNLKRFIETDRDSINKIQLRLSFIFYTFIDIKCVDKGR